MAQWVKAIEVAVEHYQNTAGDPPTAEVLAAWDDEHGQLVKIETWQRLTYQKNWKLFLVALSVRGIRPVGDVLTPQQKLAIEWITNFTDTRSIPQKLRALGIPVMQWNLWLKDRVFKELLDQRSERIIEEAKGAVTLTMTQRALSGDARMIEYFDKRAGRNPDKQEAVDGREVIRTVVDVLAAHLSKDHPDLMRAIAAELEVRLNLNA